MFPASRFVLTASAAILVTLTLLLAEPAGARELLVGVNVVTVERLSEAQQDELIGQLEQNGVKTVRTVLANEKSVRFMTRAFQHGISTVAILYPTQGMSGEAQLRPADPSVGLTWAVAGLSQVDPAVFRNWLAPQLAALEAAGVRLTAFELGNEINTARYDGDFLSHGSGRVLGATDLNNPRDPQAKALAAGYRNYLQVLAELKQMRDSAQVNRATPLISAGLTSLGVARGNSGQKQDAVSVAGIMEFLRQNGLDRLVEGYGIHAYTAPNPSRTVPALIDVLNKDAFSACSSAKPCWLTEWGFDNSDKSCPPDDRVRVQLVQTMRGALEQVAAQGRLEASIYYSWAGHPGEIGSTIFRCGSLTEAGKMALQPL